MYGPYKMICIHPVIKVIQKQMTISVIVLFRKAYSTSYDIHINIRALLLHKVLMLKPTNKLIM